MMWAFLTRAASERDLIEELAARRNPRKHAEGLVVADERPRRKDGRLADPAFARQAMRVMAEVTTDPDLIVSHLQRALTDPKKIRQPDARWILQLVVPDSSDPKDPRRKTAATLEPAIIETLEAQMSDRVRTRQTSEVTQADHLAQVWLVDSHTVLCGVTDQQHAMTLLPGGKLRLKRPEDAPSRSGLKLEEAIEWAGVGPDKGDLCVDLGAAPGGWSQVAVARGATVIAIDPARIKADLPKKRFAHIAESAFDYIPAETMDWLMCDMAWRPLEVAKLLAKWGRRVWARQMIVNLKLPMKQKAKILYQCLDIIRGAGWENVKVRQLYYDRDEVTLFAYLSPALVVQGYQAPFKFRSREGKSGRGPRGRARGAARRAPRNSARRSKNRSRGQGRSSGRRSSARSPRKPRR